MNPVRRRSRSTLGRYRAAPLPARLYTLARLVSSPFDRILDALPPAGRLLDVGCGSGLFCLMAAERGLTTVGIDPDRRKVEWARTAASGLATTHFYEGHLHDWIGRPPVPRASFEAVSLIDVLYLEPPARQKALLRLAGEAVAPGGRLLVKTMRRDRVAKYWLTIVQETLAVRVLRYTQGQGVTLPDPADLAGALTDDGWIVAWKSLDRGYPHPHVLLVGQRP